MKICVFSDSHGCHEHMVTAIRREDPALFFFLGDGERDLERVCRAFPALPYYAVRGNCDFRSTMSASLTCAVGGVRIFAAHGHLLDVKYDPYLEELIAAARAARADVALFGHTHRALLKREGGLTLLNPGSIGRTAKPSYGLLEIENGQLKAECRILRL